MECTQSQIYYRNSSEQRLKRVLDSCCAFLLMLCPILQHYKGLLIDASSDLMILCFPYVLVRMASKKYWLKRSVLSLIVFGLYVIANAGFALKIMGRELILIFYYMAVSNGSLDRRAMMRIAKGVAIVASVAVMVQYFCYYVLGFHLRMVPSSLLLSSANQWIRLTQTGRVSVLGKMMSFYRPSAFFLEPSHMAIYCSPVLALLLLSPEMNRKRMRQCVLISAGILLSTSGLGIGVTVALWALYAGLYVGKRRRNSKSSIKDLLRPKNLLLITALIGLLVLLYFGVSFFRSSINRIFISASGGNNAIQGRTSTGMRAMRMLSGTKLLIGMRNSIDLSNWNMSGFFYTVFQYGLIGGVLNYVFYVYSLKHLKREYFWLCVMIIVLSFFTVHTYAAFYRMYFVSFLLIGYDRYNAFLEENTRKGGKKYARKYARQ